jgi:hypothetical protein
VNVERDLQYDEVINEYLLTPQSRASLDRILSRLIDPTPGRAWTLTGPYGSGKSYFGLFLINLLSSLRPGHSAALANLRQVDPLLAKKVTSLVEIDSTSGFFTVPITGYRGSFQECLQAGFLHALKPFASLKVVAPLWHDLQNWTKNTNSRQVIAWLQAFCEALPHLPQGFNGLVIVLDEMGKALEYSGLHPEITDVFLLQEIAEFVNSKGEIPVLFVGILHQAFERYASFLSKSTQREWSKVQGRFEDIAFQEPPIQQMHLAARSIDFSAEALQDDQRQSLSSLAIQAERDGWRPPLMGRDEFLGLCQKAYPLHPASLTLLPFIFKRLAQNERSLFSFLASSEPSGFQEFLHTHHYPDSLRLPDLFDYLTANFQARLMATGRARHLAETVDRINSTPSLSQVQPQPKKLRC